MLGPCCLLARVQSSTSPPSRDCDVATSKQRADTLRRHTRCTAKFFATNAKVGDLMNKMGGGGAQQGSSGGGMGSL